MKKKREISIIVRFHVESSVISASCNKSTKFIHDYSFNFREVHITKWLSQLKAIHDMFLHFWPFHLEKLSSIKNITSLFKHSMKLTILVPEVEEIFTLLN